MGVCVQSSVITGTLGDFGCSPHRKGECGCSLPDMFESVGAFHVPVDLKALELQFALMKGVIALVSLTQWPICAKLPAKSTI